MATIAAQEPPTTGPPRIRVVHLVATLEPGGLEMLVLDLARHADRRRFAVQVVCLGGGGRLEQSFGLLGIPVHCLGHGAARTGKRAWRLVRLLGRLRPHVLHSHNFPCHLIGALAARAAGVPRILHTKHGSQYPHSLRARLAHRVATALTDCLVGVSREAALNAHRLEGVPRHKLRVIHNGTDLAAFGAPARAGARAGKTGLCVARLHPAKDHEGLLRAARMVADADSDFQLSLVGDGPSRQGLETLAATLGLAQKVHFLGFRRDVPALLADADFFVLASHSEGLPLAVLEAMAAGLPVVATRVGGVPEAVIDGQTGFLIPPESPAVLARAVLSLLRDGGLRRRLGEAGRRQAELAFGIDRVVAAYQALYTSMLGEAHSRVGVVRLRDPEP